MGSKWTGRKIMSVMLTPDLQKRLKVLAALAGINRSELVERLILEILPGKEREYSVLGSDGFDWAALRRLRKASP